MKASLADQILDQSVYAEDLELIEDGEENELGYVYTLANGHSIVVTKNHIVLKSDENGEKWYGETGDEFELYGNDFVKIHESGVWISWCYICGYEADERCEACHEPERPIQGQEWIDPDEDAPDYGPNDIGLVPPTDGFFLV